MRKIRSGTDVFVLTPSSGVAGPTSGSWVDLGVGYTPFTARCFRGTTAGTSNFAVSIRGTLTTVRTTGAAVGAIGAYTPSTLIAYTQAVVGKLKMSTALVPARYVKFVVATMTTAAGRRLRVELVAMP